MFVFRIDVSMNFNCANDTYDGESSIGKLSSKDKTDFGKPEVTSGKEKSEGTVVKVAFQAVIRENYRTFRNYGIMRNLQLRPFDYSFSDRYWEMKNEPVIKNSIQIHFENFDIKN